MCHHIQHVTVLFAYLFQCRFQSRNLDLLVDVANVYSGLVLIVTSWVLQAEEVPVRTPTPIILTSHREQWMSFWVCCVDGRKSGDVDAQ